MIKKYFYRFLDSLENRRKNQILKNLNRKKPEDRWPLLFYDILISFLIFFRLISLFALFLSAFLFNEIIRCKITSQNCLIFEEYKFLLIFSLLASTFFEVSYQYLIKNPNRILKIAEHKHKISFFKIRDN
ncbi:hypothetical protein J4412_02125 [Candidatus Pacearchaeota archaeon]|nr:MAG: hypothetical protein QJ16_C0001G0010 [archaeon GW2011_AR1]MBS3078279.1 hypothetical protein [Candidatus Pacearchaeota archaeon]